ncbi:hypothetical protein SISNIDRAFT_488152 [Sistotremastrum niveocremeum HHB9708]|uniref:Uncharacterized protein n=1 Tax=Sistotremastrum niveocremeum HHB9708 TaxID=1314777 RepID=A0A164RI09_9AGAM|nr:hypothetical protein SISNIDRAFT_488152 [Sistotremastrum niveocremeum HHB9708]
MSNIRRIVDGMVDLDLGEDLTRLIESRKEFTSEMQSFQDPLYLTFVNHPTSSEDADLIAANYSEWNIEMGCNEGPFALRVGPQDRLNSATVIYEATLVDFLNGTTPFLSDSHMIVVRTYAEEFKQEILDALQRLHDLKRRIWLCQASDSRNPQQRLASIIPGAPIFDTGKSPHLDSNRTNNLS